MRPIPTLRKPIDEAFALAAVTLPLQVLAVLPTLLFPNSESYFLSFLLPQILYPLLCAATAMTVSIKLFPRPAERRRPKPITARETLLWLFAFLAAATVMNRFVDFFCEIFSRNGTEISDPFAAYAPTTLGQAIGYVIAIVICPAICEEIFCRATIAGEIAKISPTAGILLSAFAFALMHGSVRQIPFAFALGLILAAAYLKTENILLPILLHFANNAWATALNFTETFYSEPIANRIQIGCEILWLLLGIPCAAVLIRRIWRKKREQTEQNSSEPFDSEGGISQFSPLWHTEKEPIARAVLTSTPFWIFTLTYLAVTVLNAIG